ncbi:MAG: type II secretion system protein [Burkholderiales bacterium]
MPSERGFTLVEMAIVLVIVGLLLGGMLMPLSAQIDQRKIGDTQKTLDGIKEALIGFAVANGRLPCPASPTSNGVESPVGGGACSNPYDGFLPAATLGITPTDSSGYAVDAWGLQQNRIRYAVTTANSNAFTTASGMRTTGIGTLAPNLYVCASATGITATSCGTATALTSNAPAVIFSLGKNAPTGGTGTDEAANLDNNPVFVFHTQAAAGAANGEFDDLVTWLSLPVLLNRMVTAGQLP